MSEVVQTAEDVVRLLEEALEKLQAAQASVPAPTLEEMAEIRQGKRPLTEAAYRLGVFQRAILAVENAVSDLRAVDLETLLDIHELKLSEEELNAIEQAIAELRSSRRG